MNVGEVIDNHRLIACVGTGGVGKTTLAAALAVGAALRGRRTMVLTIDPAHQLARALGLESLSSEGERVPDARLREAGSDPRGTLDAAMLDQKRAWDAFIDRHAPSPAMRDRMLGNPFYQKLSASFAGATEYAAMEELCRIDESGDYDLIVLDTPPTGGALDFLRAPGRLDRLLLDRDVVSWMASLVSPSARRVGRVEGTARMLLRRLERATGGETLRDIGSFFGALASLFTAIEKRTKEARALLHGPETAFVLVAASHEHVLAESARLRDEVAELGAPMRAVVLNRARVLPGGAPGPEETEDVLGRLDEAGADPASVTWLRRTQRAAFVLERAELARWHRFERTLPSDMARALVPEQETDLHSMRQLGAVAEVLWADESEHPDRGG